MAYFPKKPRSELTLRNCVGVGVFDTRRMFQLASPGSVSPALSPMRGSGTGVAAFAICAISNDDGRAGPLASETLPLWAQAPAPSRPAASAMTERRSHDMRVSIYGLEFVECVASSSASSI